MGELLKQLASWGGQLLAGRLDGNKTYLAVAGLIGLALYQFSQGQYEQAVQTLFVAAGVGGLRHALDKLGIKLPADPPPPTPPQEPDPNA